MSEFDEGVYTLTLGGFDLSGEGGGGMWRCDALSEGTDLSGNPVPVEVAIQTLIQDGSVSYTEKYDNATITIRVCIKGPDAEALDLGAAALFAELGRPNELVYQGPLASTPVAWDVINSHLERNADDFAELRAERYYTVTLSVLPFRRKTTETITPALPAEPVSPTTVTVDDGTSTTGWTGTGGTLSTSGGAVIVDAGAVTGSKRLILARTGSINTSTTKFLAVDWKTTSATPAALSASTSAPPATPGLLFQDPPQLMKAAETVSPISGYTRTWFFVSGSSVSAVHFWVDTNWKTPPVPARRLWIANIDRTDDPPGSTRQRIRTIEVAGSARTPGSIAIEHSTSALGDVLAYFWPAGLGYVDPRLRSYQLAATDAGDAAAISSVHTAIETGTFQADIPTSQLVAGGHLLTARLSAASSLTVPVSWSITTVINGVDVGPTVTGTRSIALTTSYVIVPLTRVNLPTRDVDPAGAGASVRVTLSAVSLLGAVYFDEGWLFNREIGQLVRAACGTGTPSSGGPSKRLFIEPATATTPRPVVRRGHAADRSDSFHPPGLPAWQFPEFKPPLVSVMTVTTNADDAQVSFRHYERLVG